MAAPAGWYHDGSGVLRWWDGERWTEHVQPLRTAATGSSLHLWWALSPAYTCGFIAFIPALHAAMKLRQRDAWAWAIGLIIGNVLAWTLVMSAPDVPDGTTSPPLRAGTILCLVLAVIGTVHAFRCRDAVFGSSRAPARIPGPGDSSPQDQAVMTSLAARRRRQEAMELCVKDPGLARDLMIGRPDLARQYDDGGLVDVNHVPAEVLVSHLRLSPDQAQAVVAAREYVGGFESIRDLDSLAGLAPRVLEEIQDRVVVL